MAGPIDELDEVAVEGRNRFPGAGKRVSRAREVLSPGTVLPRVQALLNPRLYRERADTNNLLQEVFAEGGALARLAVSSPELASELRNQAESPMTSDQHQQFRSVLLGMVAQEAAHESAVQRTIADNEGFMQAFAVMDSAIPGIRDPKRTTIEEKEREQIALLYQQAQQMALLDPEGSKAMMSEVRKKADMLTANVRQFMEQRRKAAIIEDSALWSGKQERLNEIADVVQLLQHDRDESGKFKKPNEAIIGRALAALGRASSLPDSGYSQAAAATAPALGALAGGGTRGAVVDAAVGVVGMVADKITDSREVDSLIERLQYNASLIEQGYATDRQRLFERYAPAGIEFGAEPGEAYAVIDDAYKAQASKIPEPGSDAAKEQEDRNETLRLVLTDELDSADEAVAQLAPEASANVPGAAARLAAAIERQKIARDDLAIFEDDSRQAAGVELESVEGIEDAPAAQKAIEQARARRQQRQGAAMQSQIRRGIQEALRGHTR